MTKEQGILFPRNCFRRFRTDGTDPAVGGEADMSVSTVLTVATV